VFNHAVQQVTKLQDDSVKRWRELLASERDAAALYSRLAEAETGERQEIFRELATIERGHAAHWESQLREAGAEVPAPGRPGMRTRLLGAAADRLSVGTVLPLIERAERADAGLYDHEPDAAPGMAADERAHARALGHLMDGGKPDPAAQIRRRERWHRGDRSGLLAGSFSMAAGEYISMSSQREMYEREISLERAELEEKPDEEHAELVLIYRAKGLSRTEAERLADQIMADRSVALDTLAREELGLDPGELGSPWFAAVSSLLAFALGALVVIVPYLAGSGVAAAVTAIGLALAAMFGVGATIGALNGRSAIRMGLRQMLTGALAAAVTYGVGHLIGAHVS